MLNEEKIKLMTSIAMFEQKEGKKIFPLSCYFRSDYISRHLLGAFFGYTLCCLLGLVLWVLYHLEELLADIRVDMLLSVGQWFVMIYGIGLVLYLLVTAVVYWRRYEYSVTGMRIYISKLRRLEKRYEYQNKVKEMSKEGVRYDRSSGI